MTVFDSTNDTCTACGYPLEAHDYVQHTLGACTTFAPSPQADVVPIASWREQAAFEAWAKESRYEMHQHPLHYLFTDKQTNAARQGWKAALQFVRELQPAGTEGNADV